jgi:hypothetical protein
MKYELAKALNDAGFPQSGNGTWTYPPDKLVTRSADRIYVPTLSELIAACEDRELTLYKKVDPVTHRYQWRAFVPFQDVRGVGDVPEEAVALLWLAMNKKV